jgi:hypothetical protein
MNADVRFARGQLATAASTRPTKPLTVRFIEPACWQAMNDAAFTKAACGQLLQQLRDHRPLYRAVALWRKTKPYLVGNRQDPGPPRADAKAKGFEPFPVGIGTLLRAAHPALWSLCVACKGINCCCLSCRGTGFTMTCDYPALPG